ncbi:MAG: NUDIX domain-containing protein, partial [Lutibacter sp.]
AQELISDKNPGDFNQAIMEFGATICKPQNPLCSNCIFKDSCLALSANKVLDLPVKTKRIQVKKRYFNFLVFINNQKETIIEKRTYGIWKNLYQFPLIETEQKIDHNHLIQQKLLKNYEVKKAEDIVLFNDKIIIHKLTHQHLYIKFWIINKFHANEKPISWNQIKKFPVPLIIDKFINQYSKTNFFSNFER